MISKIILLLGLILLNIITWFVVGMLIWKNHRQE